MKHFLLVRARDCQFQNSMSRYGHATREQQHHHQTKVQTSPAGNNRQRRNVCTSDQANLDEVLALLRQQGSNSYACSEARLLLQRAIREKNLKLMRILLANGVKIEALNEARQTPIHYALEKEWPRAVGLLFSHRGSLVNHSDRDGLSHLHIACATGNVEAVRGFLTGGADPDTTESRERFGPLHFAVRAGQLEVVRLLLAAGVEIDARDRLGRTALHHACQLPAVVGDILLPKKYGVFRNDNAYVRALAAQTASFDLVILLMRHGADPNARDSYGDVPLSYIFRDGTLHHVDRKYSRGSLDFKIFNGVFCKAKRAIIRQLRKRQRLKFAYLIQHGADPSVRNNRLDSLAHHVIRELVVARSLEHLPEPYFDDALHADMLRTALRRGAPADATNADGERPLQMALECLSTELVHVLLRYGANPIGVDLADGLSLRYPDVLPGLEAVANLMEIVRTLRSRGVPLALRDRLALVRFLVRNNAKCRYADPDDEHAAFRIGNLLELGTERNIVDTLERVSRESRYYKGLISSEITAYLAKLKNAGLPEPSEPVAECLRARQLHLGPGGVGAAMGNSCSGPAEVTQQRLNEYCQEGERMATTNLSPNDDCSVLDLLHKPDRELYSFLRNTDCVKRFFCSERFYADFYNTRSFVKGHLAKCLVRRFVIELAAEFMRPLLDDLPEPCCERIAAYLNNEDLYNVCVASSELTGLREHQRSRTGSEITSDGTLQPQVKCRPEKLKWR